MTTDAHKFRRPSENASAIATSAIANDEDNSSTVQFLGMAGVIGYVEKRMPCGIQEPMGVMTTVDRALAPITNPLHPPVKFVVDCALWMCGFDPDIDPTL